MNANNNGKFNKDKSNKITDILSPKSHKAIIIKVLNCFLKIKKLIIWLINKIFSFFSKYSILAQINMILIPISVLLALLIISVHHAFYKHLYIFNFDKGFKEEFSDLYISEVDDLLASLDGFIIKENRLDLGNQLFFEIYYREFASIGIFNNNNKRIFPDINIYSETLYSELDQVSKDLQAQDTYTIPQNKSKEYIDDRLYDSIGELAKLYYYMVPIILHGSFMINVFINQTFFVAYEFDENRNILNNELFFNFPRNKDSFNENDNFTPNNYLTNPIVNQSHFEHIELINNSYYAENFFMKLDNDFRKSVDLSKNETSKLSFAHLNIENNGNINKSLIILMQQNININTEENTNDRHYMINIIFYYNQLNDEISKTNEYSTFIIKDNFEFKDIQKETEKYSDNVTFVLLISDITKYSLTKVDSQFFHDGLYDNKINFILNGINYDSFNLDDLYDPFKKYSSCKQMEYDIQYFSVLYLYKTLFQSMNYTIIRRKRLEIYLYHFESETIINNICKNIDFSTYRDYLEVTGINCWEKENIIFFDEEEYKSFTTINSHLKIPYCGCLPLYCIKDLKTLKKDGFNNISFASKINMPSKCQNKFIFYDNVTDVQIDSSLVYGDKKLYKKILSHLKTEKNEYLKFQLEQLTQLPGYHLLLITKIISTNENHATIIYKYVSWIELIFIISAITSIFFLIVIIIVNVNLKRYSLIIMEYKEKNEAYIFHSHYHSNHSNYDDIFKKNEKEENNKKEELKLINERDSFIKNDNFVRKEIFNVNDNSLLDDLFTMFCKHYKISLKDIENMYENKEHQSKNEIKVKMMMEKNELFNLLSLFSIYAPIFRFTLNLDYKMYNFSKIIKRYDSYINQMINTNKEQARLTRNILYELLSTESIHDFGLVTNLKFKYISNLNAELKQNSIKISLFKNIIKNMRKVRFTIDNEDNKEPVNFAEETQKTKLILKKKNRLSEILKNKFEGDDYLNFHKVENSFNFFLINSYYKYLKQIVMEGNNS